MRLTRRELLIAAGASSAASAVPRMAYPAAFVDGFKETITTLFWVGERSNAENAFIPNAMSYWDKDWQAHYGGVDTPWERAGNWPASFEPQENPFYVALPYGEFVDELELKPQATEVPWYRPGLSPLLKNRWVEIRRGWSCFAQWQDVGPCGEDDFAFVFGSAVYPRNTFGERAGLDVSPAVWHYLGMKDNGKTAWRFVDARDVPDGPWREIVTTSGNNR